MSNKGYKKPKQRKPPKKATKTKTKNSRLGLVLGLATLLGVPGAVFSFWPRMTVSVSEPVDVNNPFSASATITNSGMLPLNNVSAALGLKEITGTIMGFPNMTSTTDNGGYAFLLNPWMSKQRNLHPDDRFTVPIDVLGPSPDKDFKKGEVAIAVFYHVPLLPHEFRRIFPLVAVRKSDGHIHWYGDTQ